MTPSSLRGSLFGRTWSIVSPARSERPQPVAAERLNTNHFDCPFCEGHEAETEREVFALRGPDSRPDGPGWTVRVVPNKYPALRPQAQCLASEADPFHEDAARGFHEVIIETPEHDRRLAQFSRAQLETLLGVYRSRLHALSREPSVRSIALFRNEGAAAGASQAHPHSQILALPLVPSRLQGELAAAERHFHGQGTCLTCEMVEREVQHSKRLIHQNADFAALTSFAPRFPYETWIIPRSHAPDFGQTARPQLRNMASILKQVLSALESLLGPFPFNLVLQTVPMGEDGRAEGAFHWRFEILPRVTTPSGFELGSDVFIVSLPPEEAAGRLRSVLVGEPVMDGEH
jgi:UDPglucose--hexose-1-phosphate uridylyltransferase